MVGSVIVHGEKIIGEGHTSPYGGPHAEVNAINSVADPSLLREATLYVTLEPCSHYGKTPPCADLIIKHNIPKVVIGILDPNEKVAGRGVEKLRMAGCELIVGVLEQACREHHKRFLTYHTKTRPYIILKWAETADGFMAPAKGKRPNDPEPFWISNPYSQQLVHQWRTQEQAILVGTTTVLADNPRLNARHWKGKDPVRIVLDRELRIPRHSHVMDGSVKTIVIGGMEPQNPVEGILYEQIDFSNAIVAQICGVLHRNHILSVMVEGGAQTLQGFLDAGLWDEARIFIGETHFGTGTKSPRIQRIPYLKEQVLTDTLLYIKHD